MIDNLELNFSNTSSTTSNYHADDLDVLNLDNEFFWNGGSDNNNDNTLGSCLEDPSEMGQWLDNLFCSDGFNVINGPNKIDEAKEDFNRVLEEWKCHLGNITSTSTTGPLDLETLEDVISLENTFLSNATSELCRSPFVPFLEGSDGNLMTHLAKNHAQVNAAARGTPVPTHMDQKVALPLSATDFELDSLDVTNLLPKSEDFGGGGSNQQGNTQELNGTFSNSCIPADVSNSLPVDTTVRTALPPRPAEKSNHTNACESSTCWRKIGTRPLNGGKHNLPVCQLPRFSIILRREPMPDTALQEHDYCTCASQQQLAEKPQLLPDTTPDIFAGKEMKSVLKPPKTRNSPDQTELYSKLPDYYTALSESPAATSMKDGGGTCATSTNSPSCDDSTLEKMVTPCFDKLPPYITGLKAKPANRSSAETVTNVPKTSSCSKEKENEDKRHSSARSPSPAGSATSHGRSRSRSFLPLAGWSRSWSHSHGRDEYGRHCQKQVHHHHMQRTKSKDEWRRQGGVHLEEEKKKQIEDRRVVHIGNIMPGTTYEAIRTRFSRFGPIEKMTLHHRKYGDGYAFITYVYKEDAFKALEHGNGDLSLPQYELSLGGRRLFCLDNYSDLDSNAEYNARHALKRTADTLNFDALLSAAKSRKT